jgi:hypothetical protein
MVGGILSNSVVANYHRFGGDDNNSAVYCSEGGLVTDCQILGGNNAGGSGFGVNLVNSQLRNCLLSGAPGGDDSGVALAAFGSTIASSTITHNWSQFQGGGAYLDSCLMDRCIVSNNICIVSGSNQGGAGIFETNSIIRDSLILGNYAGTFPGTTTGASGGGVYLGGGTLVNCTVSGNSVGDGVNNTTNVPGQGSGVYAESGGITNCVIFGNGPINWFNAGSGVFDHCCTVPDPGGVGNIVQGPLFAGSTNGDYHLATNSPCIAAGVVQSWMTNAFDLAGNPRTINGVVDMGAYESESQNQTVVQPMAIQNPRCAGDGTGNCFVFSFPTKTNHTYTVQYTYSLTPADWQLLTNISGDGRMMNFTNQNTVSPSCFYRVVLDLPKHAIGAF